MAAQPVTRVDAETIGVCFCIEAGPLEEMSVLLAASWRHYAGRYREAPLLAVCPRRGIPLKRTTVAALEKMGVIVTRVRRPGWHNWHNYFGKCKALLAADKLLSTDLVAFLDTDCMVLQEPSELALRTGVDIAGCPGFDHGPATTGADDPNEKVWSRVCELAQVDIDALPWVTTVTSKTIVRLYFNGGVFVFRRGNGFAEAWSKLFDMAIHQGLKFPGASVQSIDEVTASVALVKVGLTFSPLSYSHNASIPSWTPAGYPPGGYPEAVILHYHHATRPQWIDQFKASLAATSPSAAAIVEQVYGRVSKPARIRDACIRTTNALRSMRRRWYLALR